MKAPTKPKSSTFWTRHLGGILATWLIVISGQSFLSLLDAFH